MKKMLLVMAMAIPFLAVQASDPVIDLVLMKTLVKQKSIYISLANLQKERSVLSLRTLADQELIYSKVIKDHNGFSALLNLAQLPKGRYLLQLQQESGVMTQVVVVDNKGINTSQVTRE
jgi:hypothetical protein